MENLGKVSKFFLFLVGLSFILWSGTYISKFLLVYQFFEPEMNLKPEFQNIDFSHIFDTISSVILLNLIAYPTYIISLLLFLFISKISIKKEGWFFIIIVFTILTAPFEIYSLTYDYEIVNLTNIGKFDNILNIVKEKIISLGSFPFVQFFFIVSIAFLIVFKPLRKKNI